MEFVPNVKNENKKRVVINFQSENFCVFWKGV